MKVSKMSWRWWKHRKPPDWLQVSLVLVLLFVFVVCGPVQDDTEGDQSDRVNVISIENLDALLKLKMAATFDDNLVFTNKSRRWTGGLAKNRQLTVVRSHTASLCTTRHECMCNHTSTRFVSVSCVFDTDEDVEIGAGSLPDKILELQIQTARRIKLLSASFTNHPYLSRIIISHVDSLYISSQAFVNLSSSHFQLDIRDCHTVTLGEHSFRDSNGPVSATIHSCTRVTLHSSVFSWLLQLDVQNVPSLVLHEHAFSLQSAKLGVHGPATTILFENVTMTNIPNSSFPSSAAEIRFTNCNIQDIQSDSFSAIQISSIYFINTRLRHIDGGAFRDGTLIQDLEFSNVDVDVIASNAVLSAVTNLTIQNSRINDINTNSFNITVATVQLLDNTLDNVRRYSFQFNDWNKIIINNNYIINIEPDGLIVPFKQISGLDKTEFTLNYNTFSKVEVGSLSFVVIDRGVDVNIYENRFERPCHCHMLTSLKDWTSSYNKSEWLFNTSYCSVDVLLARCFDVPQGYLQMKNFTTQVCGTQEFIVCKDSHEAGTFDSEVFNTFESAIDREKKLLKVIFLFVVGCTCVILAITGLSWLRNKGAFTYLFSFVTPSSLSGIFSRLFNTTNIVNTNSISRINIHEYAEIQNQLNLQNNRIMEEDTPTTVEEDLLIYEDKATQTLPEELTQELLQTLREKLDDPDNYNEARDMIEHLYDLIKVEDSCNDPTSPRTSLFDEEEDEGNIYDIIQPKRSNSRPRNRNRNVVSIGTRVPSPDKLLPLNYAVVRQPPTVICDYMEPRDKQQHLYTELPMIQVPDVIMSNIDNREGYKMANRPLPSKPDQPSTSYS